MASSRKLKDTWIRSFTVTDPTKHEKGFTVYKVTYRAFSLTKPEEILETVVWKRYNDFKKLHKALYQLHYNMRRPEKFPLFAKAKFFGRFDDEVVEERRQSALKLLVFVAKIHPLTRSIFFQNFFQGGEEVSIKQSPRGSILQPKVLVPDSADAASHPSAPPSFDSASTSPSEGRERAGSLLEGQASPSLGGVWLHRQNEEDVTEYGAADYADDDDDDRTTFSEDSVPSTPLPQLQDMSFFDPLSDSEPPGNSDGSSIPQSNSWLFQAMDMCAVLNEDSSQDAADNSTAANSTTDLSTDSGITINFPKPPSEAPPIGFKGLETSTNQFSFGGQDVQEGGRVVPPDPTEESRNERSTMARAYLHCIRAQQAAERDAMYTDGGMVDSRSPDAKPTCRSDGTKPMGMTDVTVAGEDDYLYQAAYHISLALENEANGSYQAAFDLYKSGVSVLLKGVIADDNKTRREAVRRKTAQYLMKAEDLYNKYLSAEATNSKRWESEHPSIDVDPRSAHLRGSLEELKNYKVLGLIDTVLLVLDTVTYRTFVIKVLQKCSIATKRTTCAPANCKYVVKPYRFIETEYAIYLILEHASGGKLWSYASGFLNHGTELSYNQGVAGSLERRSIGSCGSRRSRHSTASSKDDRKHKEEIYEESVYQEPDGVEGVSVASPPLDQFGKFVGSSQGHPRDTGFVSGTSPGGENSHASLVFDYGTNSNKTALKDVTHPSQQSVTDPGAHVVTNSSSQVVTDSIASEFAELDIQDTETNLNDLASRCSQYGNLNACNGVQVFIEAAPGTDKIRDRTNDVTTAPMNLFSIDSLESPGSELHSAGSADKTVFGFGTPPVSRKPGPEKGDQIIARLADKEINATPAVVATWLDHNPEDVIADALKVMDDLEKDDKEHFEFGLKSSGHNLVSSEFEDFHSLPQKITEVDTLPDTSGFATVMTEDMTSSKPGTDLAEFFDTNLLEDAHTLQESGQRPPPVRHSMSMYERRIRSDSPPRHRQHCNPLDFRVIRSASFEEGRADDALSSLMHVKVEEKDGFESVSSWEAISTDAKTKSEPNLREMLGEATSNTQSSEGGQASLAASQSEVNSDHPNLVLPQDLSPAMDIGPSTIKNQIAGNQGGLFPLIQPSISGPSTLSLMSNQESSETTIYSSCESTPKHAIYSPDCDSGAVMDSPNMDCPNLYIPDGHVPVMSTQEYSDSNNVNSSTGDRDATPTHHNTFSNLSGATATRASPIPKPCDATLPSLTTLFAQMDEQVMVTKSSTLPESCVRLWAAEILLALTDLHAAGIVCQDLRPHNILLVEGGHIRLTYFSQWQYIERTLNAFAKEHFYTAPEVNGIFSVTPASDWWSFGVLLYELLTGMSLHSCHPSGISSHTQLILPDHVSAEACSLLKQLLQVNPQERLGSHRAGGAEEIRLHPFFKDINWTSLQKTAHS